MVTQSNAGLSHGTLHGLLTTPQCAGKQQPSAVALGTPLRISVTVDGRVATAPHSHFLYTKPLKCIPVRTLSRASQQILMP